MNDIAQRLAEVRQRIDAAARRVGRDPGTVRLVAVSKKKPAPAIAEAWRAGCEDFGENYVQELCSKAAELRQEGLRWHFIGHLQRNKVGALLATPGLVLIHGVDDERLLRAIDSRATEPVDVLLEVELGGEATKSGCPPEALPRLVAAARACERVRLRGLMAIPPPADDPEEGRAHFRRLRALRDSHDAGPELSMGMSHDFEVAIEEGATLVRVGTAIFGARG